MVVFCRWNHAFKNQISTLQNQAKDKQVIHVVSLLNVNVRTRHLLLLCVNYVAFSRCTKIDHFCHCGMYYDECILCLC